MDHFAITETTGSALTDKIAGSAFNVKIVAQDVFNNTVTSYGSTVSITASGSTLTGSPVTSGAFVSGVLSSQSLTLTTSGTGVTLSASGGSKSGTSGTFNVTAAGVDHFVISTITSPQVAGTAITGITLTAQDVNNNTVTSFTGTVTYSGTAGITGTSAAFTAGVLTWRQCDADGSRQWHDVHCDRLHQDGDGDV